VRRPLNNPAVVAVALAALLAGSVAAARAAGPTTQEAGVAATAVGGPASIPVGGATVGTAGAATKGGAIPTAESDRLPLPKVGTRAETGKSAAAGASTGFDATRVVLSLGAVIGLIFILKYFGRRFLALPATGSGGGVVQVLHRTTLSPRQQLVLIRVGRRVVLVGNTGAGMSALCEVSEPDEVAELIGQVQRGKSDSATAAFGSAFRRERQEFEAIDASPALPPTMASAAIRAAEPRDAADDDDGEADDRDAAPAGREASGNVALGRLGAEVAAHEPVDRYEPTPAGGDGVVEPALATTRDEIGGLMDKVRTLSKQFSRT